MTDQPSERELLVRIDERTKVLHDEVVGQDGEGGIKLRVRVLEDSRVHAKGWIAGVTGTVVVLWSMLEYLFHRGH